jgi:Cu(I)/Ag(I) efflux system membrane fusion protein
MHPEVVRDEPGSCPICGMTLVQVPLPQEPESGTIPPPSLSAEHSEVHLDPSRVQMIGVRTGKVARRTFAGEIRTVVYVTVDEARLSMIHTKVPGWIDRLYVSRMGERVRRGQVVATLHSLELIAAQEDFLAVHRNAKALSGVAGEDLQAILSAARRRLLLFGMTEEDIDTLADTAKVEQSVRIVSHVSGFVVGLEAMEGHQVEPGTSLLTIGDLSEVWALLDLYEFDVGRVRAGQHVKIELEAVPGESLGSTIDYVYPTMDQQTRTIKARVLLPNPDGRILPGMFGEAVIQVDPREALVVPFDALIDTGTERYVFVVAAPGHFVPTPVQAGLQTLREVEILSGLSEGQLVVTSGNFLIDSESRMLGAAGTGPATGPKSEKNVPRAGRAGH